PRSLDHRPLGQGRGREGRARPGGARRGGRPSGPDAGPRRDLFWGRPTLVGIEPSSMTAVFCRNAADRKADTWAECLAPFVARESAVPDAAKGIAGAVADIAARRRDAPDTPALEHGLDVFHTTMEARRVLAGHWRRAEAAWAHAEDTGAKVAAAKRRGLDARGVAQAARAAWAQAVASFERVERLRSGPGRGGAAAGLVTPHGRLREC